MLPSGAELTRFLNIESFFMNFKAQKHVKESIQTPSRGFLMPLAVAIFYILVSLFDQNFERFLLRCHAFHITVLSQVNFSLSFFFSESKFLYICNDLYRAILEQD